MRNVLFRRQMRKMMYRGLSDAPLPPNEILCPQKMDNVARRPCCESPKKGDMIALALSPYSPD